jgi:putative MATE family efflux protein
MTEPDPPLTSIPLARAIFRLAWPAMTSMMLVNVFNMVDVFWVGRLGTSALGGMTASAFLVWCLHAAGQLVNTGVNAVVARRVGQRAPREAGVASGQGLLLALALALLVMALGLPLQAHVFWALGLTPEVRAAAVAYLTPVLWGFPTVTLWYAVEATFRGAGDTRTPMLVLAATLTINAALDPLLIFGPGPLPALGIAGAGWATVISHLLGVAAGLTLLRARSVRPRLAGGPQPALLWLLLRVGAPIAITSLLFSIIYLLLTPIIARHGSAALAAIGVGHRVEGLCYFTCMGFAAAAATLVGQHLGASQPGRAARAAWLTTGTSAALLAVLSLIFYLLAPQIFAVFSSDPEVIAQGTRYLRIVALFETAMALELVLEGAFSGAGDTLPPMLVGVPLTAARIPAAYLLSGHLGLGVRGIWWAISVSTGLKGLLTAIWFRLGHWKRSRV